MVKREVVIVAHLLLGVVALEMIIGGGVLHLDADLQDGEASPAAGAGKVSLGGHILRNGSVCEISKLFSR